MVYKKFIKRNGKDIGPYYYTSIREKNGKVKTIYLGNVAHGEAVRKEALVLRRFKTETVPMPSKPILNKTKRNSTSFKIFASMIVLACLFLFISADGSNYITGFFMDDIQSGKVYYIDNDVKIIDSGVYEINIEGVSKSGKLFIEDIKSEEYNKLIKITGDFEASRSYFMDVGYGSLYFCANFKNNECLLEWKYVKNIAGLYRQELKNGGYAVKEALF
jgi:hypothetical protein